MEQNIIRKKKWFWPWQDAQEETWLEEMSRQGLHLQAVHIPVTYDFVHGAPSHYVYRLDFQDKMKQKNKEAYLNLFHEAGWEHLGTMGGWQYFRKLSEVGKGDEIFTDSDSKVQKYQRFMIWFAAMYPIYFAVFMASLENDRAWVMWIVIGSVLTLSTIWAVVVIKVWGRIKQLKAI